MTELRDSDPTPLRR